jgi:protein phosphatase
VGERDVSIAHVGDSRAYCLRDGELLRLTDDHSLVDELLRQGRLTPEEAEEHPQRSVITRALGPEGTVEVDTRSFHARAGDLYLLCSDGLTTMLSEAELARVLREHTQLRDAGEALIAAANAAGGRDNITVLLVRLEEVGAGVAGSAPGHAPAGASDDDGAALDATIVGAPAVSAPTPSPPVRRRQPRRPQAGARAKGLRRVRVRRAGGLAALVLVLAVIGAGLYVAMQSVYFIGTNGRGLVTLYRGVPFKLPGNVPLYSSDFVSGVSASTVAPARRRALLDHSLRSEANAATLVRSLEQEELE